MHAKGRDRVGGGRAGRGDRGGLVGGGDAGRERDDEGTRRLGRRGRGRLRGGLGRGLGSRFGGRRRRSAVRRRLGRRFRGRLSGRRRVGRWRSARLLGWRRRGRWIRGVGGDRSDRRHQREDKEADLQPDQESPKTTAPPIGGPGIRSFDVNSPTRRRMTPADVGCALVAATRLPDDDGRPYGHWATDVPYGTSRPYHAPPAPDHPQPTGTGTCGAEAQRGPFAPVLVRMPQRESRPSRAGSLVDRVVRSRYGPTILPSTSGSTGEWAVM